MLVGFHRPAAKRDDRPGVAADRNHQPVSEPVDHVTVVPLHDKAALKQHALREALRDEPGLQPVPARGRKAKTQGVHSGLDDASVVELLPGSCASPPRQLLAETRRGHFVDLEQLLPDLGVDVATWFAALGLLGQRHAELLGEHPHRVGKRDLLMKLQELEHVAAHAAAEAMKEALLRVDVKRRRFFGMEWTEPFVGDARLLERHVVLHDLHDVGLQPEVVDELLRK